MAVLRRRSKLVSFRLSEQEYEALQSVSASEGARSISDFARTALCQVVEGTKGSLETIPRPPENSVTVVLEKLTTTMGELNVVMHRLSKLVEGTAREDHNQRQLNDAGLPSQ